MHFIAIQYKLSLPLRTPPESLLPPVGIRPANYPDTERRDHRSICSSNKVLWQILKALFGTACGVVWRTSRRPPRDDRTPMSIGGGQDPEGFRGIECKTNGKNPCAIEFRWFCIYLGHIKELFIFSKNSVC